MSHQEPPTPFGTPEYGTPSAFGTPPPPGSSTTAELPGSGPTSRNGEPAVTAAMPQRVTAGTAVLAPPPAPGSASSVAHRGGVGAVRTIGILAALALFLGGAGSIVHQFFTQTAIVHIPVTQPVRRLVTDTGTGSVRVRLGRPGEPLAITETLHWTFDRPAPDQPVVTDGILTLKAQCTTRWFLENCATDLDVTIPPGTGLTVRTTTGDVFADVRDADAGVKSTTGDVTIHAAGAASVDALTNTGDVDVRDDAAGARIGARTNTGDVTVSLTAVPSDVAATTNTGDVTVTVPPGHGYLVDAATNSGTETVPDTLRNVTAPERITAHSNTGDVTVTTPGR